MPFYIDFRLFSRKSLTPKTVESMSFCLMSIEPVPLSLVLCIVALLSYSCLRKTNHTRSHLQLKAKVRLLILDYLSCSRNYHAGLWVMQYKSTRKQQRVFNLALSLSIVNWLHTEIISNFCYLYKKKKFLEYYQKQKSSFIGALLGWTCYLNMADTINFITDKKKKEY